MLWQKAWLETRWRFVTAMIVLTLGAGSIVFDYLATERLLPRVSVTSPSPAAESTVLAGAIRDAIEVQKDFRGFVWYQAFLQNITQMCVFFAVLLGCGGLLSESSKGSALFTLSLPVTRRQLLGARTSLGLAQVLAMSIIPPLSISILAPLVGQRFSIVDALAHGVCIFVVATLFYSLA